MKTTSCNAFSWNNYNNGTCWLKTGQGTIVVDANVISSIVNADTMSACQLEAGIDYVDNDIGSATASSASFCCSICTAKSGCRAFTWTNHNGGTCWLKSAKGNMVMNTAATSAQVYKDIPTCGLQNDIDYVGNDIGSAAASSASKCCSLCQAYTGCRMFSWNNVNGSTCWFKNRKDATKSSKGVVSARVTVNPAAPSCALEVGVDYVDNDIGSAASSDAYGCCSICMKKSGCKAFSWNNHNGGTCWLKSAKGSTKTDSGVKSAVT